MELHDVEIPGTVGLEGHGRLVDVDVLDAIEGRPALPVIVIGGEGPFLVFGDAGDGERAVANVILGAPPPVVGVSRGNLLLDGEEGPEGGDGVKVGRRIGQVDLGEVVDDPRAECGFRLVGLLGVKSRGSPSASTARPAKSSQPTTRRGGTGTRRGGRVAVLNGVAEVLRRERRSVAVGQIGAEGEGDLGGVVVVRPGLRRARNRLLISVEPGEALVGQLQDIDLGGKRAL